MEFLVQNRAGAKKHFRDGERLAHALGPFRESLHVPDAANPAMVSEDGPIQASEVALNAGEVVGGGRDGDLGEKPFIPQQHLIRSLPADRSIGDLTAPSLHCPAFRSHPVLGGIDHPEAHIFRRRPRNLHNAAWAGRALRQRVAEAFQVSDGLDHHRGNAALARGILENLGQLGAFNSFRPDDRHRFPEEKEGLRVLHQLDAFIQQGGAHLVPRHAQAGEAVGRHEIFGAAYTGSAQRKTE